MTADEFEDYRIELADEGRLETQHPTIVFFSKAFNNFLSRERGIWPSSFIKDDAWIEVATLLGDRYWKHEWMWDDCIAALGDGYSWLEFVDKVLSTIADEDEEMHDHSPDHNNLGNSEEEQDKVGSKGHKHWNEKSSAGQGYMVPLRVLSRGTCLQGYEDWY
ncbi:hypothetical protein M378DRAFT_181904 [Amanita muscaria Koide BX008]|uniref:Uncharacterized protein n=1 Tax=Amanita muscaria (strain Koide BX008) TaxID=946122 RepID=A0A0C2WKG0_AMAMK|nr:hypothetical protein M378DRAFT_181904 [Amanita muscaria Koide BX008]